jgi:glutamine amidotransferase
MCRFVAYIGEHKIFLRELLSQPINSLIQQSREARQGSTKVNADGFGLSWYDSDVSKMPGIYKSTQPAWNDYNLLHLVRMIASTCFIGHVRNATMGDVGNINCHPFCHETYSFVHNGTIFGFNRLKRHLRKALSDGSFDMIKGNTDSEHFFSLLLDNLPQGKGEIGTLDLYEAVLSAIRRVKTLKENLGMAERDELNLVFTNGQQLVATRYCSAPDEKQLSLYYSKRYHADGKTVEGYIVASEPLTDLSEDWLEVPGNHAILVNDKLQLQVLPIIL